MWYMQYIRTWYMGVSKTRGPDVDAKIVGSYHKDAQEMDPQLIETASYTTEETVRAQKLMLIAPLHEVFEAGEATPV